MASSVLARLQQVVARLPAAALPKQVDGIWRKAEISAKRLAKYRKLALEHDIPWPIPEKPKGVMPRLLDPKGHKADRLKAERLETIEKKLKEQPKFIEQLRKEQAKRKVFRPKDGFDVWDVVAGGNGIRKKKQATS